MCLHSMVCRTSVPLLTTTTKKIIKEQFNGFFCLRHEDSGKGAGAEWTDRIVHKAYINWKGEKKHQQLACYSCPFSRVLYQKILTFFSLMITLQQEEVWPSETKLMLLTESCPG